METIAVLKSKLNMGLTLVFSMLMSLTTFAQDSGTVKVNSVNSKTTTTTEWYTDPVYLILGGIALLIIIVLLARSGKNKN
ncbi:hypothetical protein [Chryseobacterium gossypii]|uniref:hypothetical protein n=1 Tax=Chryseobacterium gossypii TaxID=3231602 RepID=UPI003523502C